MIKTDYKSEYPIDYRLEIIEYFEKKRIKKNKKYLIEKSITPVMTTQISSQIYEQWLSKII